MNLIDIKLLLDNYYAGKTSHEDEQKLRHFFSQPSLPPEWEAEKAFFLALAAPEALAPDHLEARLKRQIAGWQRIETNLGKRSRKAIFRWVSAAAACLLLVGGITALYFHKTQHPAQPDAHYVAQEDTYKTPEEASKAADKALKLFSEALNDQATQ